MIFVFMIDTILKCFQSVTALTVIFEHGIFLLPDRRCSMLEDKVKQAIQDIRPALQNDGGDIEFVSLAGKEVTVRLVGACAGCPMSQMTLKGGVERYLRNFVDPQLTVVNER
jgi:Fe-S cluster biogenesis protein NfuA